MISEKSVKYYQIKNVKGIYKRRNRKNLKFLVRGNESIAYLGNGILLTSQISKYKTC